MRTLLIGFLLASASLSFSAQAKKMPVAWQVMEYVGELKQFPGETEQQFLVRTAIRLRDYTQRTGFEGCGTICASPTKGQAIMLFSGQSQVACPISQGCPLGDYTLLPIVIHTHPPEPKVLLNEKDAESVNYDRWLFKKKAGRSMLFSPRRFSPADYKLGPGYMVYRNEVWYQHGRGTAKIAFMLPARETKPDATDAHQGVEN